MSALSSFHARHFDPVALHPGATGWVPTVYIDDRYVEIFYGGVWNRKSREFGSRMIEDILREGNMVKGIPLANFGELPSGEYQFPAIVAAEVDKEVAQSTPTLLTRLKRLVGS